MIKENLSVCFWNVDGIHYRVDNSRLNKLDDPSVSELLRKHDVICLVETHCSPQDHLTLSGYTATASIRPKSNNATKYTGGLSVLVKNEIRHGISFLNTSSSEYMWLKISKKVFNLDDDIYVAVVYICPQNSSFYGKNADVFDLIETDIAMYEKLGRCLVLGDFNARTSEDLDFCSDDNIDDYVDLPFNYIQDVPLSRSNQDTSQVNPHGKKLLDLCKSSGLRIVNGRTLGDTNGRYTCFSYNGNPSVIDYALASNSLLRYVCTFRVNDPSVHSIHCSLSLLLKTKPYKTAPPPKSNPGQKYIKFLWSKGDDKKLTMAFSKPENVEKLEKFYHGQWELNENSINEATEKFTEILLDVAKCAGIKSRIVRKPIRHAKRVKNKKWFDISCSKLKKDLTTFAAKLRASPYDGNLITKYRLLRRQYKKRINEARHNYVKQIHHNLETIQNKDPKSFWKLYDDLKHMDEIQKVNPISTEAWINHFHSLLNKYSRTDGDLSRQIESFVQSQRDKIFNSLNFRIKPEEIALAANNLKKNKSPGVDGILNEMIQASMPFISKQLTLLFNSIFSGSHFPKTWRIHTLSPLLKKGDIYNPSNYRGIAIGSNLSKLFLTVLHNRLNVFVNENNLIPKNQIGYRKGSRTTDHILTLKSIIDKYISQTPRKYLFACFVDFRSAFDSVCRKSLHFKLLKNGVGGNFLALIQDMYQDVQYCMKIDGEISKPFESSVGMKQGCVLSPLLFNMFLSDLPDIFGINCDAVCINDIDINCLMYADDIVIFSETANGLQSCLNALSEYCTKWQLTVNLDKTKIIIFNKGGHRISKYEFHLNGTIVEIVQMYTYLGIPFTSCGSFQKACMMLSDKAKKAFFKLRQLNSRDNVLLTLKLFQALVVPILSYGCEVWGPFIAQKLTGSDIKSVADRAPCENVNVKLCKYLLGVSKYATNDAVKGELGRYPLLISILTLSMKFYSRTSTLTDDSLVSKIYNDHCSWRLLLEDITKQFYSRPDLNVEQPFDCNIYSIRYNMMSSYSDQWLKSINRHQNNKLRTYSIYKETFALEPYILQGPVRLRRNITKLRISAHSLAVETGRYTRPKTLLVNRTCKLCNNNEIEDEIHMFLKCPFYNVERSRLFKSLSEFSTINWDSNLFTFKTLMNVGNSDCEFFKPVSTFINECFEKRKSAIH